MTAKHKTHKQLRTRMQEDQHQLNLIDEKIEEAHEDGFRTRELHLQEQWEELSWRFYDTWSQFPLTLQEQRAV